MSDECGTVAVLSHRKAEKDALSLLTVERITENTRWDNPKGECQYPHHCSNEAEFIVSTIDGETGWRYCGRHLEDALRRKLERPKAEIEKLERESIARLEWGEAQKRHAAAGLCCKATGRNTYCARPAVHRCHDCSAGLMIIRYAKDAPLLCSRHAAGCVKRARRYNCG